MTPYEVLGIAPDATADEAEDAYNRLLLIHHPDLHHGGSADEIAAAESRTRLLNQAMHQIRASFANASMQGGQGAPDPGSRPPGGPTGSGAGDPAARAADPAGADPDEHATRWEHEQPPPVGMCPFCGERFNEGARMRAHVSTRHKVRLEHRRRSRVGRGLDRLFGRWDHVSLWHLAPLNVIVALIIAVAVAPLAIDFAYWVFGVAMAPTIILALERPGR